MAGRVLIIEDEPDIAELLRYSLQREGFETRVVHTGEEGIQAALDFRNLPSLILLDPLLPGISGAETYRQLRSQTSTKSTPLIIITPKGVEFDIRANLELGANDYIVTPFSVQDVVAVARSLLLNNERHTS